ncbi:MAG: hypothetical protein K5893_07140 [Prevotella sp.]|nr:hypothetical protein [Prevotella sp.]
MMTLERIGKKMPYAEKDDYVERLVEDATECAIHEGKSTTARRINMRYVAGIAASVLLLLGIATVWHLNSREPSEPIAQAQKKDPLGAFLNSISDEEAKQIEFYEIEEIYY